MRGFLPENNQKTKQRREGERCENRSRLFRPLRLFRLHPLFCVVGVWYAFSGELFLFLLSTLVAIQHECAHAFAAAKLGYRLNALVLMPFGAVIDGDLRGISFKDEIFVALCGPLCNLVTAILFVALWWFSPSLYPFTDVAFYSSMSIALVNLLPLYPLDGGRILQCSLARAFSRIEPDQTNAERKAKRLCRILTLSVSLCLLAAFLLQCLQKTPNFSLLAFSLFLFFGGVGNKDTRAVYEKVNFSFTPPLKRGVEIRKVAVSCDCAVKDVFRFLARGSYLVLEVYSVEGNYLFDIPQNLLATLFQKAKTPYDTLLTLWQSQKKNKSADFFPEKEGFPQ